MGKVINNHYTFSPCPAADRLKQNWRYREYDYTRSIPIFVDHCLDVTKDPADKLYLQELYQCYCDFCNTYDLPVTTYNSFSAWLTTCDIHLEPQESEMVVRMRIDGLLQRLFTVPTELQSTVISRLKIMGGMNIAEHKIPQDGQAVMQLKGHEVDLRISSLPTVYGEKIVLRLLDKSNRNLDKESLGIEGRDLELYNALLKNTGGVILLVGPTGSGKSTTLYAMIRDLARDEVNIVTLEDPVEYHIPGVSQCQINEKTGMTFANGLRAILRQDPDIISVGEIRDGETAGIAMRSAITGHLVTSFLSVRSFFRWM